MCAVWVLGGVLSSATGTQIISLPRQDNVAQESLQFAFNRGAA